MNSEMNCLVKKKPWKLIKKPKDKKIIDVKQIFTIKSDNRQNATVVVIGSQQAKILEDCNVLR